MNQYEKITQILKFLILSVLLFSAVISTKRLYCQLSYEGKEEDKCKELAKNPDAECPEICQKWVDTYPSNHPGMPCSCYKNSQTVTMKDTPLRCLNK